MQTLETRHQAHFNHPHNDTYFAPIPLNILGETADVLKGPVLIAAYNEGLHASVSQREDLTLEIHMDIAGTKHHIEMSYNNLDVYDSTIYERLIRAMIKKLQYEGYKVFKGLNITIESSAGLPVGYSVYATLEVLLMHILTAQHHFKLSKEAQVRYAYLAEKSLNELLPTIAQHYAVMFCKNNHITLLDTKTLDATHYPVNDSVYFLGVFVARPKFLIDEDLGKQIKAIDEATKTFKRYRSIDTLASLTFSDFNGLKHLLSKRKTLPYVEHVMFELDRIDQASHYLKNNDYFMFGDVLEHSHHSLFGLYDVVAPYHERIVNYLMENHAYGARLCTISHNQFVLGLFHRDDAIDKDALSEHIRRRHNKHLHIDALHFTNGIANQ